MTMRNAFENLALDSTVQGIAGTLQGNISTKKAFLKQAFFYDSSGRVEYIAYALPGALKTESVWAIEKFVYGDKGITDILYAGGNSYFNKICNDYANYTYS